MMKIDVEVKPKSKVASVEKISDSKFLVRVNAPPVDGKANEAVIKALAKFFGVRQSSVRLLRGEKSKHKVFEIGD